MSYPRRLGQTVDCTDSAYWGEADCIGVDTGNYLPPQSPDDSGQPYTGQSYTTTPPGYVPPTGGINWGNLFNNFLTDVTQLIRPGTPSPRPIYTAGSTAAASILGSPVVLIGLAAVAYAMLSKGRR